MLAETGEATFFVIQLQEETEAAPRELSEVKDRAIADYKLEQAILAAKNAATDAQASDNAFDSATSGTMKRSGAGLDHPAANLIAAKAFEIDEGDTAIIETGEEAILLITDKSIAAPQGDVDALAQQLTNSAHARCNLVRPKAPSPFSCQTTLILSSIVRLSAYYWCRRVISQMK